MLKLLCLALLLLNGCGMADPCSSSVVEVTRDPHSDRYAVTEVRNCGATTGFTTVIRVGRASRPQREAEEVLVADSDHGAATGGPAGTVWTNVVWTGVDRLEIALASHARAFKKVVKSNDVSIVFRLSNPTSAMPVD